MKKNVTYLAIATILLLFLVAGLTGCTGPGGSGQPPSASPPSLEFTTPAASPPSLELTPWAEPEPPQRPAVYIEVYYVADPIWDQFESQPALVNLDQFASYHEVILSGEEAYTRIVITTEVPLRDFHFVEVDLYFLEQTEFMWAAILYSMDELTPETPFVASFLEQGTLPHRGIVFFDETFGWYRFFSINVSGYDGSIGLVEAENGLLRSPRTAVTGILADPNRAFTTIYVQEGWDGARHPLSAADAAEAHHLLTTMDATEVLTPFHYEGQHATAMFTLFLYYGTTHIETIYSTDSGQFFFRFTDTHGNDGDPGYVGGFNEALYAILSAPLATPVPAPATI